MPEISPPAQLAIDTLELMAHDVEIAPAQEIFTQYRDLGRDYVGLLLTGNTKRARIGNLYEGIDGDFRVHNIAAQMGMRSRSLIEARLEFSPEKRAVAMVLRACEAPVLPYSPRHWQVISSRWSISVSELLGPRGPEGILESVLDEDNILGISSRKADLQHLHETGNRNLEVIEPLDRAEAIEEIRRVVLQSGEVDWHNLDIPENI